MQRRPFPVHAALCLSVLAACNDNEPLGPGGTGPCGAGPVFDVSALPVVEINHIAPLGNLSPPGHTLPTAHTYWNLHEPGAKQVPVYAPADFVIWRMDRVEYSDRPLADYTIDFEVCQSVRGRFAHVTGLSPGLDSAVAGQGQCQSYTTADGTTTACTFSMQRSVAAGEVIGYVGDAAYSGGLDFGLEDDRVTVQRANPQRFGPSRHVCPIDYYEPGLRAQLETRFGDGLTFRTTPPVCGRAYFDVPGTASGSWFKVGGSGFLENYALALAADNVYPASLAFSIGLIGSAYDGYVLHFAGASSGRVRRVFEEVVADGDAYCYDELQTRRDMAGTPIADLIVLIQLQSDGRLSFETQAAASCGSGPWAFTAAAVTLER